MDVKKNFGIRDINSFEVVSEKTGEILIQGSYIKSDDLNFFQNNKDNDAKPLEVGK